MRSVKQVVTRDVGVMTDRVMIDLFKKNIRKTGLDPEGLKGNWAETRDILQRHFVKVSRIMNNNQTKLQKLYQTALKELK
jgi:hypothetical protein